MLVKWETILFADILIIFGGILLGPVASFSKIYIFQNFIYLLNLNFFNFKFIFHRESILYI